MKTKRLLQLVFIILCPSALLAAQESDIRALQEKLAKQEARLKELDAVMSRKGVNDVSGFDGDLIYRSCCRNLHRKNGLRLLAICGHPQRYVYNVKEILVREDAKIEGLRTLINESKTNGNIEELQKELAIREVSLVKLNAMAAERKRQESKSREYDSKILGNAIRFTDGRNVLEGLWNRSSDIGFCLQPLYGTISEKRRYTDLDEQGKTNRE